MPEVLPGPRSRRAVSVSHELSGVDRATSELLDHLPQALVVGHQGQSPLEGSRSCQKVAGLIVRRCFLTGLFVELLQDRTHPIQKIVLGPRSLAPLADTPNGAASYQLVWGDSLEGRTKFSTSLDVGGIVQFVQLNVCRKQAAASES
jgi:hypothetical protein